MIASWPLTHPKNTARQELKCKCIACRKKKLDRINPHGCVHSLLLADHGSQLYPCQNQTQIRKNETSKRFTTKWLSIEHAGFALFALIFQSYLPCNYSYHLRRRQSPNITHPKQLGRQPMSSWWIRAKRGMEDQAVAKPIKRCRGCMRWLNQSSPWMYQQRSIVAQRRRMYILARCSFTSEAQRRLNPFPPLLAARETLHGLLISTSIESQTEWTRWMDPDEARLVHEDAGGLGVIYLYAEAGDARSRHRWSAVEGLAFGISWECGA